ncbi:MAG: hypothetical protein ACXW29_03895 [Thermoanaerobaculia bacterium]
MFKLKHVGVAAVVVLVAAGAMASNFRAADQVYVPAAGHLAISSATFISDVWISNVSTVDTVSVSVIYTPTGTNPAPQYFDNVVNLLPGERKEYTDFFVSALGQNAAFGSLIFNGCKQGADCIGTQDDQGVSLNFRDIVVFSRIYSIPAGQTNPAGQPTNGQDMPGIPWYNFVSSRQAAGNLSRVFIQGIRNTGTSGTVGTNRSNIGLMNASQYSTTTIVVKLFNGATRQQIGSDFSQTLGPLGFVQPGIGTMFPGFAVAAASTNGYVTIEQTNNVPTNDAPATCLPDGCPGFLAYASILDNATQDATTVEAVYEKALSGTALDAIYGTNGSGKSLTRRSVRRSH